ncbi:HAD family hydrolase [Paenibacillus koleovorans]|uniref:HAD family hydrolase n=1 Tax=Paenibacillus koleovorans TaxID=121608 RepID=UPI000FDB78D4|nr:HAD family hydrolase [Paenibacillus koleovorans]
MAPTSAQATQAFLTDLDGTLLRSDATVSPFTVETLTWLLEQGVPVSYATARSYRSSMQVVGEIPWQHPLVLYNGAVLMDPVDGSLLGGNWLTSEAANELIEFGKSRHRLVPLLFGLDGGGNETVLHEPLLRTGDRQFYANRPNDPRFRETAGLVCPFDQRVLILTYIGRLEELEPFHADLTNRFGSTIHLHLMRDAYVREHNYFLEVSHPLANKKQGLLQWARIMGIEPSQVTVFGDNLNDVGLFEAAGTRVAVREAHERLQAMADRIIGSHNEDAVAKYMRQQFG